MARLTKIIPAGNGSQLEIPFIPTETSAGFPTGDFSDDTMDLNEVLIASPSTTYFGRVSGDSMSNAGIGDGDLLIVERIQKVPDNVIAVCFLDGEHILRRVKPEKDCCWLISENEDYPPIRVEKENELIIWGMVLYTIKPFVRAPW